MRSHNRSLFLLGLVLLPMAEACPAADSPQERPAGVPSLVPPVSSVPPASEAASSNDAASAFDLVTRLDLRPEDPVIEGHGASRTIEYTARFGGAIRAWVRSPTGLDTMLRVEPGPGRRYEDDDSGGKPDPYMLLRVGVGSKLLVTVFASKPGAFGMAELHLHAFPETDATRVAVAHAKEELAEVGRLRGARDFAAAEPRLRHVVDELLEVDGSATSLEIEAQIDAAAAHSYAMQLHDVTERLRRFVVTHRTRTLPEGDPNLFGARGNLGLALLATGQLGEARRMFEALLEQGRRLFDPGAPRLESTLLNLSKVAGVSGDLVRARELLEELLASRLQRLPEDAPEVLAVRSGLATTLQELGELERARRLQEQVLVAWSKLRGEEDEDRLVAQTNLANTLYLLGDLTRAYDLKRQVLAIESKTMPHTSLALQQSKLNLTSVLIDLRDLEQAHALLDSALEVTAKQVQPEHPLLLMIESNLGAVLSREHDLQGARALQETVLAQARVVLREGAPDLQLYRLALARTYCALEMYEEARALAQESIDKLATVLDAEHPMLARAHEYMAQILLRQGDLEAARTHFHRELADRQRNLPDDHLDLQDARIDNAVLIALEERIAVDARRAPTPPDASRRERYRALVMALTRGLGHRVQSALLAGSSREAEILCVRLAPELDTLFSLASGFGVFPDDQDLERATFLLSESSRGAALTSARRLRAGQPDAEELALRQEYFAVGARVAKLAQGDASVDQLRAAIAERDAAERFLTGGGRNLAPLELGALAPRLGTRSAIVAFRRYTRSGFAEHDHQGSATDELCAFVLRGPRDHPEDPSARPSLTRVELGAMAPIEAAVRAWRKKLGVGLERGKAVPGSGRDARSTGDADEASAELGRALRRLVLDPLLPALGDSEHLVLTLDDVLHLVPFEALPLDAPSRPGAKVAKLAGDRWRFEVRCTLTELVNPLPPRAGQQRLVVLGDPSFNSKPIDPRAGEAPPSQGESDDAPATHAVRSGAWERTFHAVPDTGAEARGIASLHLERFRTAGECELFQHREASRAALLESAPRARWLHIATHGWFMPESVPSWDENEQDTRSGAFGLRLERREFVRGMSPMLLSGLALAGANLSDDDAGRSPGLITAEELSAMDLPNCDLAVLSACDTNVGERRAGQGISSLQKALHMGGARSVITSLWSVPDEATSVLMLEFYRRLWLIKEPKWKALWEAKRIVRETKDDAGSRKYTTRDWAAWVLTGDPE